MNKPLRIVIRIAAGYGTFALSSFILDALSSLFISGEEAAGFLQIALVIASIILPIALGIIVGRKIPLPMQENTPATTEPVPAGNTDSETALLSHEEDEQVNQLIREIFEEKKAKDAPKPESDPDIPEVSATPQPAPEKIVVKNPEYVNKTYRATGMEHRMDSLMSLSFDNPDYKLSKQEIVDQGLTDERIFQKEFIATKIELVPEPDNPYDKNAIKVVADGRHIAYIKRGSCAHLLNVINEGRLLCISADIGGGRYKYVYKDEDREDSEEFGADEDCEDYNAYETDFGTVKYFVHLTVMEREK